MTADVEQLEARLAAVIRPRGRLLTAYSGGVDSTLVAAVARHTLGRADAPAAIGDSASLPRRELDAARALAAELDLELIELSPGEQDDADYRANAGDRCYHCKSHLYDALRALADQRGIEHIANGANADDLGDHRPGLIAAQESRIVSPLLEARFAKADVRALAAYLGLPNADKPAAACLASRLQYGTEVTPQRLAMIEAAEAVLHDLRFTGFRVRHHETQGLASAPIARIELPLDQLPRALESPARETLNDRLRALGYVFVTLDLAGFRSGSANVVLNTPSPSAARGQGGGAS